MNNKYKHLGIMVDMAGCPNRCRHCWLGDMKNGHFSVDEFRCIAEQFKNWKDSAGNGIERISVYSWWREPDFRADYKQLWQLEQELSSPGAATRFELLSTWRLARYKKYAEWAASLPTKACQITFFGMEENTDWGMRRAGAFADQLKATERCIEAGISPRWQLFITRRCINELEAFLELSLEYKEKCNGSGLEFEFFIGGMSPEGCGYELEDIRLVKDDLALIPEEMIRLSRDGIRMLGITEEEIVKEFITVDAPPKICVETPCLAVDADLNVHPNLAEPAEWWKLGNLKTDGVDVIMQRYLNDDAPGLQMNNTVLISDLTRRYGDITGHKLYTKGDLLCRFMHQWGMEYINK